MSILLSQRLSITRGNLAVLERACTTPASGPAFARVTSFQAAPSSGIPSLVDQLEHLSIATGRVSGTVCDACGTPRPEDTHLRMCSRCNLASCAISHAAAVACTSRDCPQVLQRRVPTDALAFALHRVLCAGLLLTRRHSNSARPAAARRPQRPRCIGAVVCVRRGQNRALECGPGRQRRVHISEGGQPASPPPPPVGAVLPNVTLSSAQEQAPLSP